MKGHRVHRSSVQFQGVKVIRHSGKSMTRGLRRMSSDQLRVIKVASCNRKLLNYLGCDTVTGGGLAQPYPLFQQKIHIAVDRFSGILMWLALPELGFVSQ